MSHPAFLSDANHVMLKYGTQSNSHFYSSVAVDTLTNPEIDLAKIDTQVHLLLPFNLEKSTNFILVL